MIGIDIDDCFRGSTLCEPAAEIVRQCQTYTERSPSGDGLHLIGTGSLPAGFRNKYPMEEFGFKVLEIYDKRRYFTMTGDIYGDKKDITSVDVSNLSLPNDSPGGPVQRIATIGHPEDSYLIEQIKGEQDGMVFTKLHDHGDCSGFDGDQSRADLAYIGILAK